MRADADTPIWVSELVPTTRQNWSAAALVAIVLVVFGALVPIATRPAAELNSFFPTLDAIVLITDLITAVLLLTQFSISRSRSLLALAFAYLFTALIVVPHALTFAGAFSPTGLLGANRQTGSWLFIFWHFGFSAALLAYAALRRREDARTRFQGSTLAAIGWCVASAVLAVVALTWLSTAGTDLLPAIITPQSTISPTVRYPIWATILLTAAALLVLAAHRRSVLDLWLMVVAFVFILELVFSGLLPSARFSVGFYAGRVLSLLTACIVLVVLLEETMRLYAELARSNLMLVLERNNKLMNIEAVASSISHELKQPLGAILLNCETAKILLQRPAPDIGQTIAVLDETIAATNRANEQLEGARALFGRADREQEIINVSDIADRAVRLVARELRSHNIATRLELPAKAVYAIGHGNQIQQVIINLLVNAIEALSRAPPENRVLRIAAGAQGGTAVVEIEDSGDGVDPAKADKIFEPFVTSKPSGMGLGLAICRTIVDRHGGKLAIAPGHPRGTIVRLALPAAADAQPALPRAARPSAAAIPDGRRPAPDAVA
ncbi:MAG: sensor histidine kinase [Microvirga sp.]